MKTLLCRNLFKKYNSTEKKYENPLPWKNEHELLLGNYLLAKNRLVSFVNRLKKDPVALKTYDSIIKSEEAEGIIEEPPTFLKPPGEVHYLPHHLVLRPEMSTTKLRIVYDDLPSVEGQSLNQCPETGPNLLPNYVIFS